MIKAIQSALLSFAIMLGAAAQAQDYPSRTITFIVPYAPGGTNDIIARAVAAKMSQNIGQAVIVENKPGASGGLGAVFVAKAAPDGYTILTAPSNLL